MPLAMGAHVVHLYADDRELVEAVGPMLARALLDGDAALAVATPQHLAAFRAAIVAAGVDLTDPFVASRYHALEARTCLATFMEGVLVDGDRFARSVGARVAIAAGAGRAVHVFGEMVGLLWDDGNIPAALEVEMLWNELAEQLQFALYCGYRHDTIAHDGDLAAVRDVCDLHSEVLTPARYRSDEIAPSMTTETRATAEMFVPVPLAARAVRRFVVETLTAWDLAPMADDACVVASELATNAFAHARSPFRVELSRTNGAVRVAVSDASTSLPVERDAREEATNGRGMALVSRLSTRSGFDIGVDGKVVWADLPMLRE